MMVCESWRGKDALVCLYRQPHTVGLEPVIGHHAVKNLSSVASSDGGHGDRRPVAGHGRREMSWCSCNVRPPLTSTLAVACAPLEDSFYLHRRHQLLQVDGEEKPAAPPPTIAVFIARRVC